MGSRRRVRGAAVDLAVVCPRSCRSHRPLDSQRIGGEAVQCAQDKDRPHRYLEPDACAPEAPAQKDHREQQWRSQQAASPHDRPGKQREEGVIVDRGGRGDCNLGYDTNPHGGQAQGGCRRQGAERCRPPSGIPFLCAHLAPHSLEHPYWGVPVGWYAVVFQIARMIHEWTTLSPC